MEHLGPGQAVMNVKHLPPRFSIRWYNRRFHSPQYIRLDVRCLQESGWREVERLDVGRDTMLLMEHV